MSSVASRVLSLAGLLLSSAAVSDQGDSDVDLTLVRGKGELTNSIGMKLVRIPKGTFWMGAAAGDRDAADDERPRHEVEITRDFYLGVTEVTQKQYKQVMGRNPSFFCATGSGAAQVKGVNTDDFPVEQVSWDDAQKFLEKLGALSEEKKAGRIYRLPTEAEWEYACRAGDAGRKYHFGDALTPKQANTLEAGLNRPCKVGSYPANAYGLYDVHGNVWEWCLDEGHSRYYASSPRKDPPGPSGVTTNRVHRGGNYRSAKRDCRSAHRSWSTQWITIADVGFRVAASVRTH